MSSKQIGLLASTGLKGRLVVNHRGMLDVVLPFVHGVIDWETRLFDQASTTREHIMHSDTLSS